MPPHPGSRVRQSNWGISNMQKIDFTRLLGFAAVSDELSEDVDFQGEIIGAKLGAKVGGVEPDTAAIIETAAK
jgi:hypothetical protein